MELVFRNDAYTRECEAVIVEASPAGIVLDRTVFYPLGGGQPGDVGRLVLADGRTIPVLDTRKSPREGDPDGIVHLVAPDELMPPVGARLRAEIDWERRSRHMRMHTCLHLLSAVVPGEVTGGQVGEAKGRLDFNLPDTALDRDRIEAELNRLIEADHAVAARWITDAELDARPELVRTMSVKPPRGAGHVRLLEIAGVDLQPCGGTHVARTGEIGRVVVAKIESKGRQNRRVNLTFA